MNLQGFIQALSGAGLEFQVEDVLDALWLATQGRSLTLEAQCREEPAPASGLTPQPEVKSTPDIPEAPDIPGGEGARSRRETPESGVGGTRASEPKEETSRVYPAGQLSDADRSIRAESVAIPAGRALGGRLVLMRALRPFRQRWSSRREEVLDEEQTAEVSADLGWHFYPVLRAGQERWFNVEVVLEDDGAIGLWNDTIRDFCQVLRNTGAFRDVRLWRLRVSPFGELPSVLARPAVLETPAGGRISAGVLAGRGTRRLILFATHGSSSRWLDGSYARTLKPWVESASVVLLHLMARDFWKRTPLGDAHGFAYAREPGAISSTLEVEIFWWTLAGDKDRHLLLPVPAVSLEPAALGEWAHMQMARGRRCPIFLLDVSNASSTGWAEPELVTPRDFEQTISILREFSPEAFRLAVYLCPGAFTLPVARLVQEAKFGAEARMSHLAELLLSGLVVARSPTRSNFDPNTLYYDFRPEARDVLIRSLREADATSIASALERHVSEYIERIYGRAISFQGLVPDENGRYNLPVWAQPFAELGRALLGLPQLPEAVFQDQETVRELFERFLKNPSNVVDAAASLAASMTRSWVDPESVDPEVWRALVQSRLVREHWNGQWFFQPGVRDVFSDWSKRLKERYRSILSEASKRSDSLGEFTAYDWESIPDRFHYTPTRNLDANHCEFYVDETHGHSYSRMGNYDDTLDVYFHVDRKSLVDQQHGQILNLGVYVGVQQHGYLIRAHNDKIRLCLQHYGSYDGYLDAIHGEFAFFLDVKRSDGSIDRLWLKNGVRNFKTVDDLRKYRSPEELLGATHQYYVGEDSPIFNQKKACQRSS